MKTIEESTFSACESLKSVVLPKALEKIGIYAFYKTGLESFNSPASLREIAQGAFAECKGLKSVKLNKGLEVLGTNEYTDNGGTWYGVF